MTEQVAIPPYRIAQLLAPAVDRLVIAAICAGRDGGGAELGQRYGGTAATAFLVEFRNRLAEPGGTVSGPGFAAVTRYRDAGACRRMLDRHVAHGMLHRLDDGGLRATVRGSAFLAELRQIHGEVTEELWAGHDERVARLVGALDRVLTHALATAGRPTGPAGAAQPGAAGPVGPLPPAGTAQPGSAFREVAPPYEPDGTPPGVLLLNRLDALRQHRADAFAAAWTAAGHTATSVTVLPSGPERLAIELETNRRAAGPYRVLTPDERVAVLADLAALPG